MFERNKFLTIDSIETTNNSKAHKTQQETCEQQQQQNV